MKPKENFVAIILSIILRGNQTTFITCSAPLRQCNVVVAGACCGVFSAAGMGEACQGLEKTEWSEAFSENSGLG